MRVAADTQPVNLSFQNLVDLSEANPARVYDILEGKTDAPEGVLRTQVRSGLCFNGVLAKNVAEQLGLVWPRPSGGGEEAMRSADVADESSFSRSRNYAAMFFPSTTTTPEKEGGEPEDPAPTKPLPVRTVYTAKAPDDAPITQAKLSTVPLGQDGLRDAVLGADAEIVALDAAGAFRFDAQGRDGLAVQDLTARFSSRQLAPDGSRILSASAESRSLEVRSTADPETDIIDLSPYTPCEAPMATDATGTRVAIPATDEDGQLVIALVATDSQEVQAFPTGLSTQDAAVALSPDGQSLWFAAGQRLTRFDTASKASESHELEGLVRALSASNDAAAVTYASGDAGSIVRGEQVFDTPAADRVALSPDGQVAACIKDDRVSLVSGADGSPLQNASGEEVSFALPNVMAGSLRFDDNFQVRALNTAGDLATITVPRSFEVKKTDKLGDRIDFTIRPDGQMLVIDAQAGARLYESPDATGGLSTGALYTNTTRGFGFDPEGRVLAVVANGGNPLYLGDTQTNRRIGQFKFGAGKLTGSPRVSANAEACIVSYRDGETTGAFVCRPEDRASDTHESAVEPDAVGLSADGKSYLIAGSSKEGVGSELEICSTETETSSRTSLEGGAVKDLAASGGYVAVATEGAVNLVNLSGSGRAVIDAPGATDVHFSPDGSILVVANESEIALFEGINGEPLLDSNDVAIRIPVPGGRRPDQNIVIDDDGLIRAANAEGRVVTFERADGLKFAKRGVFRFEDAEPPQRRELAGVPASIDVDGTEVPVLVSAAGNPASESVIEGLTDAERSDPVGFNAVSLGSTSSVREFSSATDALHRSGLNALLRVAWGDPNLREAMTGVVTSPVLLNSFTKNEPDFTRADLGRAAWLPLAANDQVRPLLVDAINLGARERSDVLKTQLDEHANLGGKAYFPELIVGTGPAGADYAFEKKVRDPGGGILMVESTRVLGGGNFPAVGEAIFANSTNRQQTGAEARPGTAETINPARAPVSSADQGGKRWGPLREFATTASVGTAAADVDVLMEETFLGYVDGSKDGRAKAEGWPGRYEAVFSSGRKLYTNRICIATGLTDEPNLSFFDEDTQEYIKSQRSKIDYEQPEKVPNVASVLDHITLALLRPEGRSPYRDDKVTVFIGLGDGANIGVEFLQGFAPSEAYTGSNRRDVVQLGPVGDSFWMVGKNGPTTCDEYKDSSRPRYSWMQAVLKTGAPDQSEEEIRRKLQSGELKPRVQLTAANVPRIEPITKGENAGRILVHCEGYRPNDSESETQATFTVVADYAWLGTGYDRDITKLFEGNLPEGTTDYLDALEDVYATPAGSEQELIVARKVPGQEVYTIGAATGDVAPKSEVVGLDQNQVGKFVNTKRVAALAQENAKLDIEAGPRPKFTIAPAPKPTIGEAHARREVVRVPIPKGSVVDLASNASLAIGAGIANVLDKTVPPSRGDTFELTIAKKNGFLEIGPVGVEAVDILSAALQRDRKLLVRLATATFRNNLEISVPIRKDSEGRRGWRFQDIQ